MRQGNLQCINLSQCRITSLLPIKGTICFFEVWLYEESTVSVLPTVDGGQLQKYLSHLKKKNQYQLSLRYIQYIFTTLLCHHTALSDRKLKQLLYPHALFKNNSFHKSVKVSKVLFIRSTTHDWSLCLRFLFHCVYSVHLQLPLFL